MATYFDSGADTALIHQSVRTHSELATVASNAENDVLRRYTLGFNATDREVYLEGYNADADLADTALKDALRRTIGEVVSHRLRFYDDRRGVASESRGARSVSYAPSGVDPDWPDGWDNRLADFDTRNPFWAI